MNLRSIAGNEATGTAVAVLILGSFAFETFVLGRKTFGIGIETDSPNKRGSLRRHRDELLRWLPFYW